MRPVLPSLLVLLLLAGCAAAPDGPEAACRTEAERSPEVADLIAKGAGSPTFMAENQENLKVARQQATLACLRGRGTIRPGGVERQRPM